MSLLSDANALGDKLAQVIKDNSGDMPEPDAIRDARINIQRDMALVNLTELRGTWTTLELLSPWSPHVSRSPQAHKGLDGWVSLRGEVSGGAKSSKILNLPSGLRPSRVEDFAVAGNFGTAVARVYTSGNVYFFQENPVGNTSLSLCGVRFQT